MKTASGLTCIVNAQLVDGTGAEAVPEAVVQIRDGIIRYAGPAARAPEFPPLAARIDGRGSGPFKASSLRVRADGG